jgi:hypothetical protein
MRGARIKAEAIRQWTVLLAALRHHYHHQACRAFLTLRKRQMKLAKMVEQFICELQLPFHILLSSLLGRLE